MAPLSISHPQNFDNYSAFTFYLRNTISPPFLKRGKGGVETMPKGKNNGNKTHKQQQRVQI